ncbi:MAG: PASTA domain-containing protein [Ruminiclostridium sp.]|nr:PASTA domain-containing protein [Ruminiclostridium sp.]
MKKTSAIVLTALLLAFCACGCDNGKKPAESTTTAVTADPNSIEVPDFSGLTRVQVEMKYPKLNIVFNESYNDDFDEDAVISQSPEAGTKINKTDEITVDISLGGKLIEVDDYSGRNIEDVKTLIEKQGLVWDIVYNESDSVPRNCVVKTSPGARSMVEKGSTVICYVSIGSAVQEIHMPDLVGMTIEDATKVASENNISLTISYDDTSSLEPGTVVSQGIDPDKVVEPDTRVEVMIAGENASAAKKTSITVNIPDTGLEGEFELKYYVDGTLIPEKTEVKEISLTRKIEWEVADTDVHTYSIMVTSLTTGKSGKLYEMEVDFTVDPPTKNHHDTFNGSIFKELLS